MKNIIAHRGVHDNKNIPENTMVAFKKAIQHGIDIELDIRLTKDLELVVFHDENLKRMANRNELISELNLQELKKIKLLNTSETIPTLKEVLKGVNNQVLLDIEVKKTKKRKLIVNKTSLLLNNYQNFIIKSFDPWIVKKFKKKLPSCNCGLLINDKNKFLLNKLLLMFYKPDFIAISKKLLLEKKLLRYSKNYEIYVWTVNDLEELNTFSNDKFKYICNNLPYKNNQF